MVLAADLNAFHFIGGALAIWAVVLAALGIFNHNFPPKGLEKVVIAISAILVIGAIATAVTTTPGEKPKGPEVTGVPQKAGKEGSPNPAPGTGTPSPGKPGPKKPASKPAAETLQLSADPTGALKFNKSTLSAKAGDVRIVLTNPAPVPHNISLEGPGGVDAHGPTVSKGGNSQVSASLKPGKYTFYCSVPGHREAGMQGSLTVTK